MHCMHCTNGHEHSTYYARLYWFAGFDMLCVTWGGHWVPIFTWPGGHSWEERATGRPGATRTPAEGGHQRRAFWKGAGTRLAILHRASLPRLACHLVWDASCSMDSLAFGTAPLALPTTLPRTAHTTFRAPLLLHAVPSHRAWVPPLPHVLFPPHCLHLNTHGHACLARPNPQGHAAYRLPVLAMTSLVS